MSKDLKILGIVIGSIFVLSLVLPASGVIALRNCLVFAGRFLK